ncbi:hypothetical protein H4R22_001533 [Coemansia sp. RSA 1290]|nr:hypothetical protein H4R22_001533 [Coemansia sp. RSA 1290]KAJ2649650.1 hypothetical protein IWW40_002991 [Coemansia sp. RSA 1250]
MDIQRIVDAYIIGLGDNADNTSFRQALVGHIAKGDTSLLELVQALGEYLASEEASRRNKGLHVLADVLTELPQEAIPAQATAKLVQFFCSRLSDSTCVSHILTSIDALQRLPSFTNKCSTDVLRALFKEVHVQSFQHSTRSAAYGLLDQIIRNHPQAVQTMGNDMVLGFAQMLDGEKDPRSLMIAFQIIPKLAELVDIKNNVEDIFEVIFCYFPITFKNREGDPSTISPESLKKALRAAITCSPYFGEMAVKPLVEKTTAASSSVKIDAYETLVAAADAYDAKVFIPEMETLVEQIREDVEMAADDKVVDAALEALEAVYRAVSPATDSNESSDMSETATLLDYVLKDSIFQLTADEIKNPDQIGKLLLVTARSSAYNCNVISDAVLPIVLERLGATEVLTLRRELMDVLNYVLSASCDANRKAECLEADKDNLLNVYRLDAAVPLDKEYSFLHITRLKGITLLILLPEFLNHDELSLALQTISQAAIERNEDENVNKEATHLLVQLAQSTPEQIKATALPLFLDALCEDMVAAHKVSRLLNALGAIGIAASNVLLTILDGIGKIVVADKLNSSHCLLAVTTIRKMVETAVAKDNAADTSLELLNNMVNPLLEWVCKTDVTTYANWQQIVVELAKAAVAVFSKVEQKEQEQRLVALFDRYSAVALSPSQTSTDGQYQTLPIFSAMLCACWPQTNIPVEDKSAFVGDLAAVALSTQNDIQRDVCFEILASIINKCTSVERSKLTKSVFDRAEKDCGLAGILLRHWLARALIACNDQAGYECVRWLLAQITQRSYSEQAADGFNIILGNHDWAVTPETHGVFRLLFKQRFYATVVPEITSSFKDANDDSIKTDLLVALTHSVQHMPKNVLMSGISEVIPLLLSAIRLTVDKLKATSIRTITMVIFETPETVKDEIVTSIIPQLTSSLSLTKANTVHVRRAALDTLSLIPEKYPFSTVQAARKNVLDALSKARDDHKRLVRNDAVKAYNKWFGIEDKLL